MRRCHTCCFGFWPYGCSHHLQMEYPNCQSKSKQSASAFRQGFTDRA